MSETTVTKNLPASSSEDAAEDWREKDDIIECNCQMLQRQYACDVHFVVGGSGQRQGAHTYMLVSRSHVFAAMLAGPWHEARDKDIEVPDVDPDAFAQLLRYVYTGKAELHANNVLQVLYAANKYAISGLCRACIAYVEEHLDMDNACALMEQAHLFEELDFRSRVLDLVLRKGETVLAGDDVAELCQDCLVGVLGADNLICREEQVWDAMDRWAARECQRRGLEATDDNRRIMLGPTLYLARLPLMDPQVFVQKVVPRSLLSEEEKVDVMRHFLVPSMRSAHFPSAPRRKEKHRRFNRFASRAALAYNNQSGESAICLKTNQDIYVEGFTVYGTCRGGSHILHIKGRLLDANEKLLEEVDTEVTTDSKTDLYDVMFDEPRRVAKHTWHTLAVDIKGSHTYAGSNGRLTAFDGDVIFTFATSEKSQTGTSVEQGQLPGLIFMV